MIEPNIQTRVNDTEIKRLKLWQPNLEGCPSREQAGGAGKESGIWREPGILVERGWHWWWYQCCNCTSKPWLWITVNHSALIKMWGEMCSVFKTPSNNNLTEHWPGVRFNFSSGLLCLIVWIALKSRCCKSSCYRQGNRGSCLLQASSQSGRTGIMLFTFHGTQRAKTECRRKTVESSTVSEVKVFAESEIHQTHCKVVDTLAYKITL